MIRLTHSHVLPIGLDIGHDGIKLLQLEAVGETLRVVAAARRAFPDEVRDQPGLRDAATVDLVRQALRQAPFVGRTAIAALPREIVHVKNLRLPVMPAAELELAMQFEAKHIFPFDVDQATVRFIAAGEVRQQGNEVRQEVIVIAAKNSDIDAHLELLHRCGLIVESLDIESCALHRTIERFIRRRDDEQSVHMIVDVGLRRSSVIIGRGREINFIKPIEIGGRHFHDAVSRKLGISVNEAQALRRRLTDNDDGKTIASDQASAAVRDDSVGRAVFDATRSVMEELGREISLCLRYYSVTFRGHRPSRVKLVGGEACDGQLKKVLGACLTIPVESARPLAGINTSAMRQADRRGPMCEWAIALGLGMKLTTQQFAAHDGISRDAAARIAQTTHETAQVIDLNEAVIHAVEPVGSAIPAGEVRRA